MTTPKGLGGRIRQARLELAARRGRQVTLQEIGEALDVTGVTVGRWEAGQKEPDLATIERLAQVLGVTASYLAFGVEVPRPLNGDVPRQKATPSQLRAADELIEGTKADLAKQARAKNRRASGSRKR